MTRAGPLRWVTGAGWLILVGGEGEVQGIAAEVDDRLLARADFSSPIAFLPTASGSPTAGESLLECYAGLGGPRGYVVPVLNAVDAQREENYRLLAEAGLIRDATRPVKILGTGEITKKLEVEAKAFSTSAAMKITRAGGQIRMVN